MPAASGVPGTARCCRRAERDGDGRLGAHTAPALAAAFLASLVEATEALTIVLAVATVRGWRPAGLGAIAGLVLLAMIVAALGPLIPHLPLGLLQVAIGILVLLFGMRWLRKAILRAAGMIPVRDEAMAFTIETAALREQARRQSLESTGSLRSPASRPCFWKDLKCCSL
jgi:uncharacterized membrane protein